MSLSIRSDLVTRGKTSAECGDVPPDPVALLPLIRTQLGLAEGHLNAAYALLRQLERILEGES